MPALLVFEFHRRGLALRNQLSPSKPLFFLVSPIKTSTATLSGLMFILATLTRPGHAVFYVAGGAALLLSHAESNRANVQKKQVIGFKGFKYLVGYASTFVIYAGYLVWKYQYYGDIVPNTYYAKLVSQSYVGQGLVYAVVFYLANHFWLVGLLFLIWLVIGMKETALGRFKVFALCSVVVYHSYILKIGGDFMHGRFFVTIIPIMLLAVENLVQRIIDGGERLSRYILGSLVVAALCATMVNINFFSKFNRQWHITDESVVYRVSRFFPVTVLHFSYPLAIQMKRLLTDRGLTPTISTHGIGMIAYYTRLDTIDQLGLTDKFVAQLPVRHRSLPGHEKAAPLWYLRRRGVQIGRLEWRVPSRFSAVSRIGWGPGLDTGWSFVVYDRAFVAKLRRTSREIVIWDFEKYLDNYIAHFRHKDSVQILADLVWFEGYYFYHNDDFKRYDRFLDELESFRLPTCRPIAQSIME